jgi:hypothetical protein
MTGFPGRTERHCCGMIEGRGRPWSLPRRLNRQTCHVGAQPRGRRSRYLHRTRLHAAHDDGWRGLPHAQRQRAADRRFDAGIAPRRGLTGSSQPADASQADRERFSGRSGA